MSRSKNYFVNGQPQTYPFCDLVHIVPISRIPYFLFCQHPSMQYQRFNLNPAPFFDIFFDFCRHTQQFTFQMLPENHLIVATFQLSWTGTWVRKAYRLAWSLGTILELIYKPQMEIKDNQIYLITLKNKKAMRVTFIFSTLHVAHCYKQKSSVLFCRIAPSSDLMPPSLHQHTLVPTISCSGFSLEELFLQKILLKNIQIMRKILCLHFLASVTCFPSFLTLFMLQLYS